MRGSPPGVKDTVVRAQASLSKAPARRRIGKKALASAAPPADKMDETYVVYTDDIALVADSPIVHKCIVENRSHVHPSGSCVHAIDIAACSHCKGKNRARHKTPWLLDSGASNHYTNNLDDYVDYTAWPKSEHQTFSTATSTTKIVGVGTVMIKVPDLNRGYQTVCIRNVCYVPDLTTRLLSLGTFLAEGMNVQGDNRRLILEHKGKPFMVFEPRGPRDTLFGVNSENFSEDVAKALKTIHNVDYDTMHRRFAHPSDEVLKHARSHTVGFPNVVFHKSGICAGCVLGKMANRPFSLNETRAERPFELIHSDLKSYPVKSVHGYKYIVTFFDDHSSHAWHKLIKTKDETLRATRQFIAMVKTQFNASIRQWCCDQGGEYILNAYKAMLADAGIVLIPSPPYTAQVNGRAERFMCTFSEKESAMHQLAGLPDSWWEFSVEHSIHIYNRTPLKRVKWKTPYEVIHRAKPNISHLCTLGCEAYVFRHEDTRANKLAPKSVACTYVGWGNSGHRFMTKTGKFIQSAHAVFDETVFPRLKDARPSRQTIVADDKVPAFKPDLSDYSIGPMPSYNGVGGVSDPDEDEPLPPPNPDGTDCVTASGVTFLPPRSRIPRCSDIRAQPVNNPDLDLGPSLLDPGRPDIRADSPESPSLAQQEAPLLP
jgi:hypothetical protein